MKTINRLIPFLFCLAGMATAAVYHVAPTGLDANPGTSGQPYKTIGKSAATMQPGDTCMIHAGTYRETVAPARGGTGENARIVYRAAPGEVPMLKGSNQITTWVVQSGNTWKATLADTYFGSFNPYAQGISGNWLAVGQGTSLGMVYLNGEPYMQKSSLATVNSTLKTWYFERAGGNTTIYANFGGTDPNTALAEIHVRECVIRPAVAGVNYLTFDGLTVSHASTNWDAPPPQAVQKGMIDTWKGKRWIIQNCHITDSKTVGICSGTAPEGATLSGMNGHIIRKNIIQRCGEAGIAGSDNLTGSLIEGNLIEEIRFTREFGGWETAGIKTHGSVDLIIRNNVIRNVYAASSGSYFGIWLDWANQGSRITGNVIYGMSQSCFLHEMDHGPQLVDNNVLVGNPNSSMGLQDMSENSIFVHNLIITAPFAWASDNSRSSAYWVPHTLTSAGSKGCTTAYEKAYNNILVQSGTSSFINATGNECDYNVEYQGAQKSSWADAHSLVSSFSAGFKVTSLPNGVTFSFNANTAPFDVQCPLITRSFIGVNPTNKQGIENPDGSAITIDKDMFGNARNTTHPAAGPIETLISGSNSFTRIVGPDYNPGLTAVERPLAPGARGFAQTGASCIGRMLIITGTPESSVRVADLRGVSERHISLGSPGNTSLRLPAAGMYVVTVSNGSENASHRVVAW